ncbi:diaminopimelate decarboxylase [Methanothermobacter tenebrarum]|uniref:Diaminopimelate decarboxylase n=1 Tax=Methanothermobacter tenebrarum TaxID=680118 RepID=A0ABM7YBP6_9EURY|nr:diaminopimelate decarboxylase [Methanothermobacter tenebrarum]MDD3455272.1 diaminopimelate decarboxylase [Methanobacteriales archaeon]MDI6882428.1 diaminopimelate decarboxylase [Methanothermobacter sp.]BDH78734.1 diaminopimelate decarboxylase [Methanothermobacter tenebrarum]
MLNVEVNSKGHLLIGGADAVKLAEDYDTPLYVIDERRIRENYQRLHKAFTRYYPNFQILYACKANTNLTILRILEDEGSGIDAVSPGEIYMALLAGFKPEKILYTGNNLRDDEILFAVESGTMINIDSKSQLLRLSKITDPENVKISFRINPMVGAGHHEHCITGGELSKFGIREDEAAKVYNLAQELGFQPIGIHAHIGSGILDPEPFMLAVEKLMDIAGKVSKATGVEFEFIDFGGGLGIPYHPDEKPLDIKEFAEKITGLFMEKLEEHSLGEPAMYLEPGRYIVGDAACLLTRVNTIKEGYRKFAGVDAGFNTLIRPVMYGSYHHIIVANRADEKPVEKIDIAGNLCESGDLFARDRKLPKLKEGDLLAISDAGAYAFSMASQYNSRPRPAEILVKDGEAEIIRKREDFSDLINKQVIPPRLLK